MTSSTSAPVGDRHRRVRAHAAGVRAGVAVADPLEVLRRRERDAVESTRRTARAATARGRSAPPRSRPCGRRRRTRRPARYARTASRASASDSVTSDALARGEPVGLHHVEAGQRLEERERRGLLVAGRTRRGARSGPRRRRAPPSSTPSSPRAGRPRPTDRTPRRPAPRSSSAEPVDERRLGPDHDEVERRRGSRSRPRAARHGPTLGDPGVARRGQHRVDDRRAGEAPRERVLAAADPTTRTFIGAAHAARGSTTVWSRAGPTDTKLDVHAGVLLDELHVVARRAREVLDALGPLDVALPARAASRRSAGPCAAPTGGTARGRSGCRLVLVRDADLELGQRRQHVELRDRELGAGVEPARVLEHHEVEPARSGAGAPVLVPNSRAAVDEQVADLVALEQLGRERPAADARRVRLHDADDPLDRRAARRRRRRRRRPRPGCST